MARDPAFFFDYFVGFLVTVAFSIWLTHVGYSPWQAVWIWTVSFTIISMAYAVRWNRIQAAPQARLARRFSRRNMLKNGAVAIGFLLLSAVEGWGGKTVIFEAGLILGLGGLATFGEWILWRRYLRSIAEDNQRTSPSPEVTEDPQQ
jgi:cobalamin synthase